MFTIKNGVLTIGAKRILLAHVIAYDATPQTLLIHFGNHRESLNMGPDAVKCATALDEHFQNPAIWVTLPPPEGNSLTWRVLANDELRENIKLRDALGRDRASEILHPSPK